MTFKKEAAKLLIDTLFDTIKDLLRPHSSLEQIADDFSPQIDTIIRQYQKQDLKYIAGKFQVRYIDENSFAVSCLLYFQDNENNWKKANSLSPKMDASFLSPEARTYLRANREKSFDVAPPRNDDLTGTEN